MSQSEPIFRFEPCSFLIAQPVPVGQTCLRFSKFEIWSSPSKDLLSLILPLAPGLDLKYPPHLMDLCIWPIAVSPNWITLWGSGPCLCCIPCYPRDKHNAWNTNSYHLINVQRWNELKVDHHKMVVGPKSKFSSPTFTAPQILLKHWFTYATHLRY